MNTYTARLTAVALVAALTAPGAALAQERRTRTRSSEKAPERLPEKEKEKAPPPPAPVEKEKPVAAKEKPAAEPTDMTERLIKDVGRSPRSRYAFAGGGVLMVAGLGFGYWAQGESKRAETIRSAYEAQRSVEAARQSAATANVLFALSLATLAYGVLLELLPQPIAERASLTYHF